ncbi:alpha-hydroxy-acid oxidizing protein [Treponema sp.]|uniref:alpha-hydroxy-acid oxidizing protein n=1 Tax=Treponema sp. TaxID=166 RepID=UPI003F007B97
MENKFKCRFCNPCAGLGCAGELPGMGGINKNANFILNCQGWNDIPFGPENSFRKEIRLAPMTGAVENVGYPDERQFYFDLIAGCVSSGARLSIGDGVPDCKLQWGIEAVRAAGKKAAVFIKPYSNKKIFERFEWAADVSEFCGIDIDAYNILTMRNKASLEKKDAASLLELKSCFARRGIPFVIKGIFSEADIELAEQVRPDVVFVSNHGGRVEAREQSTAEFLAEKFQLLRSFCGQIWVDGGIRSWNDVFKAQSYGVSEVLAGRPFVSCLCQKKSFENIF